MFDISSIKNRSITEYLRANGYKEKRSNGKWAFFLSPFREETNPSFAVNNVKNTWADFGTEAGGDIIELVMKIENLDFVAACEFITGNKKVNIPEYTPTKLVEEAIRIVKDYDWDSYVWDYIVGVRGISPSVLTKYCHPVVFSFPNSESQREYAAVGFKNDLNGWEARNAHWKVASLPKSFRTIVGRDESYTVNLFEGFTDFLSALTYWEKTDLNNTSYVLNGTGMIGALMPMLEAKKVNYFGHNDAAGDRILNRLREEGIFVTDYRGTYEWHNDFNDFLITTR